MLALLTAALLSAPSAQAHELAFEIGSFSAPDDAYDLFSYNPGASTVGVRGGYALSERISVVGGWHTGRTGMDVYASDAAYDGMPLFSTSMTHHRASLGVKAGLPLKPWLSPYVTAQGVAWFAAARFDDDSGQDESFNELTFRGFAPGGVAALGVQITPVALGSRMALSTHVEAGYGITGNLRFRDDAGRDAAAAGAPIGIGDLDFRGFVINAGVGLSF